MIFALGHEDSCVIVRVEFATGRSTSEKLVGTVVALSRPCGFHAVAVSRHLRGFDIHNKELAQMVRKSAAAMLAMVIAVGAVFTEEIKGTFVKFADGKLNKVDDKDKEYKVSDDLKQKYKDKNGDEKNSRSPRCSAR